jgi:hypothetical protein
LKMWSGAAIWQQIGTWNPNTDYLVGLWAGRGDETSACQVELWAGGNPSLFPASGFGTIDSAVGATLIGGSWGHPNRRKSSNSYSSRGRKRMDVSGSGHRCRFQSG